MWLTGVGVLLLWMSLRCIGLQQGVTSGCGVAAGVGEWLLCVVNAWQEG
jgi:hypothetical protein